jgi:hypothetical protein
MSVALAPEADMGAEVVASFRTAEANRDKLRVAHCLLNDHRYFPETLTGLFALAEARMRDDLGPRHASLLAPPLPTVPRYLFVVNETWDDLLHKGILSIPFEVFGDPSHDVSVVSSLRYMP